MNHTDPRADIVESVAYASATPNKWIPNPDVRRWLFRTLATAGPLVVFYGLATAEEVALWLGLGATILGTPAATLASVNVPSD